MTFGSAWGYLKRLYMTVKRDAEMWTSLATLVLAIATIWLALGMNRQIGIMQDDQRPWVGMVASAIGEFGQIAEGSLVSVTSAHWAAGSASKTIAWSQ